LYSKIRPYLNKVSKPDFQGICSADIYPIRPVAGLLNRDFLRFLLMSKVFLNYAANNSDRANIPKINRKALIAFSFYRPSIEAQHQFSIVVEKVEGLRLQSQQSLMDLEALYGALSQRAFQEQFIF
jgi:type I restriction enzyme S subunit